MTSTLFVEEIKGRTTGTNANKVIVPSGQTLTINSTIGGTGGITLDANQDVELDGGGLYVTNPANSLTVDKGGIDRTGNTTRIFSARSGGNYADMSINIAGVDKSDGNNGMNRCLYIDYQGNTTLDQGDLVFGTAGKGIVLGSTSITDANTLDDYEEGTFTYGSNANVAFQSNTNVGKYTKIGNMVHLQFHVDLASVSSTNHFYLSGMPFTAGSHTANTYNGQSTGTCMIYNINTYWSGSQFCSYIGNGSTNMYFYETYDNSNWSIVTNSRITSTSEIIISHTYFV